MTNTPNSGTVSVSRELLERINDMLGFAASAFKSAKPVRDEVRAILAQPADQQGEPVAVPVAWLRFDDDQRAIFTRSKRSKNSEALYAHPTAYRHAQPVTAKVDEDAEFETFYEELAKNLPLPLGKGKPLKYAGGQYVNDFALFGRIVWQARAKLSGIDP